MAQIDSEIDLESLDSYRDGAPHAQFQELRRTAPVFWHARPPDAPFWAVTRWSESLEVLSKPDVYSSALGGVSMRDPPASAIESMRAMLVFQDPPVHVRTRKRVYPFLNKRQAAALEPKIRAWSRELTQRALAKGECDFVSELASELPSLVITYLLGVPSEDGPRLREWTDRVTEGDLERAQAELASYLAEVVTAPRGSGRSDLVAGLLGSAETGALCLLLGQLVQGGTETLRSLFSGGLVALLENPDQLALLRDGQDRIPAAVEEMMRFVSPVHHLRRTTTRDVELNGVKLPRGDRVVVFLASANRDEAIHRDPDRFDILRSPQRHIALGYAQHFCVGAHLARVEARVFWEEFLASVRHIERIGPIERVRSNQQNSISRLPVRLG